MIKDPHIIINKYKAINGRMIKMAQLTTSSKGKYKLQIFLWINDQERKLNGSIIFTW